ncbi:MAG: hypothetical protein QME64_01220, partial [bacterium]|nr:hypothetical protein [bacterium]
MTAKSYYRTTPPYSAIKFLLVLTILIFSLTGCLDKQFAKWQMGSVEKLILKAKDYEAEKYAPGRLKQTKDNFDKATQLYN